MYGVIYPVIILGTRYKLKIKHVKIIELNRKSVIYTHMDTNDSDSGQRSNIFRNKDSK